MEETNKPSWEEKKFEELMILIRKGHEPVINKEDVEQYESEVKDFIRSLLTQREQEIVDLPPYIRDFDDIPCYLNISVTDEYGTWEINYGDAGDMFEPVEGKTLFEAVEKMKVVLKGSNNNTK